MIEESPSLFDDPGDLSLWGGNDSFDMITEDGECEIDEEVIAFAAYFTRPAGTEMQLSDELGSSKCLGLTHATDCTL